MDILLLHKDEAVRDMVAFALEGKLRAIVHPAPTVQQAITFLLEDLPISLIICAESKENGALYKYLLSVDSTIPIILIRPRTVQKLVAFPDLTIMGQVSPADLPDGLIPLVKRATADQKVGESAGGQDFCRIKTNLLIRTVPLKSDVYIQLSSIKFVRMFKKGDVFDLKDMERYLVTKRIQYLYVKNQECDGLIKQLRTALAKQLKAGDITTADSVVLSEQVHEAIMELSQRFGFTTQVQGLVKQNVDTVITGMGKVRGLNEIAALLEKGKGEYISSHSVMLAHIAGLFATRTEWSSYATLEKLTFAALLHDITLTDQKLAEIHSVKELEDPKNAFTRDQKKEYLGHSIAAAEVAVKFGKIPADVWNIIREHHERPDGSGFPRGLMANRISPISALFIIAHDVVTGYFRGEKDLDGFIRDCVDQYRVGNFRKVADFIIRS